MDRSELMAGMKVITKPISECHRKAACDPSAWTPGCFDTEATVLIVEKGNYMEHHYAEVVIEGLGKQLIFHDWIACPATLVGKALFNWIRKEQHGSP